MDGGTGRGAWPGGPGRKGLLWELATGLPIVGSSIVGRLEMPLVSHSEFAPWKSVEGVSTKSSGSYGLHCEMRARSNSKC